MKWIKGILEEEKGRYFLLHLRDGLKGRRFGRHCMCSPVFGALTFFQLHCLAGSRNGHWLSSSSIFFFFLWIALTLIFYHPFYTFLWYFGIILSCLLSRCFFFLALVLILYFNPCLRSLYATHYSLFLSLFCLYTWFFSFVTRARLIFPSLCWFYDTWRSIFVCTKDKE